MAGFKLRFSREAGDVLTQLEESPQHDRKLRKVRRTLARLEVDPHHPGLRSHKYSSLAGKNGEAVLDSYVENKTPSAWRIFWHYGPGADTITVLLITPHP